MIKKDELVVVPDEVVMNKIYLICNQKVMLDSDLAELYQVEVKRLNEQVKRNLKRFSRGFYGSTNRNRIRKLEVANCDFKLGR